MNNVTEAALKQARDEANIRFIAARDLQGAVAARAQEMIDAGRGSDVHAMQALVWPIIREAEQTQRAAYKAYNAAWEARFHAGLLASIERDKASA